MAMTPKIKSRCNVKKGMAMKKVLIWCCYAVIATMIAVGGEILTNENRCRRCVSIWDGVCIRIAEAYKDLCDMGKSN